ncbi:TonB-dependent receptor [Glaciecola sp. SC05]|uniref:TonB-dependent receptor n=1 Tax=Glaciecola sp. SC05 TaxID=1987355 RepID=UPI003528653E
MKKAYIYLSASLSMAACHVAFAEDISTIESIEVLGRINSFANQSEIQLNQASSPDMRSQLSMLPGLNINGNGAVSGVLQYRGLFGDRLRVNIDGNEVAGAGPNAMDSPLSHAIGTLYQSVTLHQGIAPVSVGAETIGGAVEIDEYAFDINHTEKWLVQGGATASAFDNDNRALSALLFTSAKNLYLGFSADAQEGDNYIAGDGREVPSTFYERSALKLKAGIQSGKHRVDALVARRNTNESGTPALAMDIIFVDALWYRLNHSFNASEKWQIKTQLFGNQNQHDMNNFELRMPPMPAMFRLNQVSSEAFGISSKATYKHNDRRFEFGGEVFQRQHESVISNPNNEMFFINNFNNMKRDRASVYAELSEQLSAFDWQFGMRLSEVSSDADPVSTNMSMINPNVAALQNDFNSAKRNQRFNLIDLVGKVKMPINQQISLVLSAARKERAPSYNELYTWFPLGVSAGLADGRNYIGNLDLEKETANKIDLGLTYQDATLMMSANVFYAKIDEYILGVTSNNLKANNIAMMNGILSPLQWSNTDAKLVGMDMLAAIRLSDNWRLQGTLEYVRGKQTVPVAQDLYRLAPLSGFLQLSYEANEWKWRLSSKIVASQNKVAEQQNETPTEGYTLVNTDVEYAITQQLRISLIVENLFDKAYRDHLAGVNRINNTDIALGEKIPGTGRNVGVFLQYQF